MSILRSRRMAALLPLLALLAMLVPTRTTVVRAAGPPPPTSVTIAGDFQSELGCPTDWDPTCAITHLADQGNQVWHGEFTIPTGNWQYKAALNDNWTVSFPASNKSLNLAAGQAVRFYYDNKTTSVLDNVNDKIAVVAGTLQSKLGCPGDWQPSCVATLMTDPNSDGIYTFVTTGLSAGDYQFKVALNETWDVSYPATNVSFTIATDNEQVTISWNSTTNEVKVQVGTQAGDLSKAQAVWVTRDTIAWKVDGTPGNTYRLYYDPSGALQLTLTGIVGGQSIPLTFDPAGLSPALVAQYPNLAGYNALHLAPSDVSKVRGILKGQTAISATTASSTLLDATSLQTYAVLDDLYTYHGSLGVVFNAATPSLKLWAPTARSVKLHLFDNPTTTVSTAVAMTNNPITGVWTAVGTPTWTNKYYLYEVEVYVRKQGKVEHNLVTDPYSISLSTDSTRSQIIDLTNAQYMPAGWATLTKPPLQAPEDIVVYELHLRDFSISDGTVPAGDRGTYTAFTDYGSNGMRHLGALANAGLTHVHILPSFDFASVEENKALRQEPDPAVLASFPPDSDQQQAYISNYRATDGFNWGYDPYHYMTPEGSYATNPEGPARIRQFREMVKGLNTVGLRVVMDVVYNHTSAAGQDPKSVLDQIVPDYYYRLDPDGNIYTNTCCPDTASEHTMMQKLMVDSLVMWATAYKVDAFRFDLMGFHMVSNMTKIRNALHSLTLAKDGVDGSKIYLYGEGWDFGEVAHNAFGVNATQINTAGTGIGTFNDRIRDAVRGGGPFDSGQSLANQGFINGLFYDPNGLPQGDQKAALLLSMDRIRVGMAGNLKNYTFIDRNGNTVTGAQVDYNGQPTGYTLDPQEDINYMEAHDNQTLFDANQEKTPLTTAMADRVRIQNLGMDVIALGEGIPFYHAGVELLRSKSGDGNSYDSGDWFNRLDWSELTNNWGVGLPPAWSGNQVNWPVLQPLLANPALKPSPADIHDADLHFREMLRIRRSSYLFRLETQSEIQHQVKYLNTGPNQIPGLLVTAITDSGTAPAGENTTFQQVVVLINATTTPQTYSDASFQGVKLHLHPVQQYSNDPVVRTANFNKQTGIFTIPARTTAVFVVNR